MDSVFRTVMIVAVLSLAACSAGPQRAVAPAVAQAAPASPIVDDPETAPPASGERNLRMVVLPKGTTPYDVGLTDSSSDAK